GRDLGGEMAVSTGDGSVTLEATEGDLDVDTGDGSVSVSGKLGVVKLHTSDGSITFRAEAGTTMKDDWSMTTGDGSIALYLPSDLGADLDAQTGDGSIRNELKLAAEGGEATRRSLRAKIGAGGRTLKLRTGDGSIRVKSSWGRLGSRHCTVLSHWSRSIRCRVVHAGLAERVSPLPALAALSAVQSVLRLHARQRQRQRHAERDTSLDHVRLVERRERRVDRDRRAEAERQRARHRRKELGRGVRKRIA